jgi:uncharacterized membrane protein YbhN (UPF0104 family)
MAKLKIILTTPFVLIWFGFLAVSPILPFLIPHLPRPWDWALGTALVATLVGVVAKSRIDASGLPG